MTEQSDQLRFDIFERVQLTEELGSIEEIEEIELVPHMQTVPSGDSIQIRGHLLLTGTYRSRSERSPIRQLEHWIPIEISLPLQRVNRMEDLHVEVEQFDVDLMSGRALNVTGTLVLKGMRWPVSPGPVWQDDSLKVVHQAPKAAEAEDDMRGTWPGVSGSPRPLPPEGEWDRATRADAGAGEDAAPAPAGESAPADAPALGDKGGGRADHAAFPEARGVAYAGFGGFFADDREPERASAHGAQPEPGEAAGTPRRDGRSGEAVPQAEADPDLSGAAAGDADAAEPPDPLRTELPPEAQDAVETAEAAEDEPPAVQATAAASGRPSHPAAEQATEMPAPQDFGGPLSPAVPPGTPPEMKPPEIKPPEMKVTLTGKRELTPAESPETAGLLSRLGAQAERQEHTATAESADAGRQSADAGRDFAAAGPAADSAAGGSGTFAAGGEPPDIPGAPASAGEAAGVRADEEERTTSGDELKWARLFRHPEGEANGFRKVRLCIVQRDDTLDAIAERYRVQVQKLQQTNDLSGPYVTEGQVLVIP